MPLQKLGIIVYGTVLSRRTAIYETIPEREKIAKERKMKNNFTGKKAEPVPVRVKFIAVLGGALLMAAAIATGAFMAPDDREIPVALSDGSVITPPWYITIDGEKIALVKSKKAAEKTLQDIVEEYQNDENLILDIEIKEETQTEKMKIKNGDDPPEIMTAAQAKKKITRGNGGKGYITVITTEEEKSKESIDFQKEYKAEPDLYVGETKVKVEGKEGTKEVTKKIVRENGEPIEEEIVNEEVLQEPQEQVILSGTKEYDGYGGGEGSYDEINLSYDPKADHGALRTPVDRIYISSGFGYRWGQFHRGVDFALAQGSPVYAADSGHVYFSGYSGSYGNIVKIDHDNGMQTYYAHCSSRLVSEGETVRRGQKIALVGSTGNSTGPHLHFEVIVNRSSVDPMKFLN